MERSVVAFDLVGCYFIAFFYNLLMVLMQAFFLNFRIFNDSGDWNDIAVFTVPKYLLYKV